MGPSMFFYVFAVFSMFFYVFLYAFLLIFFIIFHICTHSSRTRWRACRRQFYFGRGDGLKIRVKVPRSPTLSLHGWMILLERMLLPVLLLLLETVSLIQAHTVRELKIPHPLID